MKYHLDITVPEYPFEIEHHHNIFLIGSCFAENLAKWLKERHFNVFFNPNGVLFNPSSIYLTLQNIIDNPENFEENVLFYDNAHWKSFLHQTHFYDKDKNKLIDTIIQAQRAAQKFLKSSHFIFITFGSAYVYEHVQLKTVVANCHKLPSSTFEKKLLSVQQIVENYEVLLRKIKHINPDVKIILSVSPVKYLAYGTINNNISKATLILAVHELCNKHPNIFYFPAYELITDDLRDYRFYKEDMAHPNEAAIKYVMKKFSVAMISSTSQTVVTEIEKIMTAMQHQVTHRNSSATQAFAHQMLQRCEMLETQYPHLKLDTEKEYFAKLLTSA
ncbi:MAG: hypothetical protein KatS3mg028_1598 [Bacteroidia bacterium]|nr:MAG: hypothetical protein KatS3mg028_1598 [Bacteroidia bacterium]